MKKTKLFFCRIVSAGTILVLQTVFAMAQIVQPVQFVGTPNQDQNYVVTKTIKIPNIRNAQDIAAPHTNNQINQTTIYYDGLGRPLQNIITQGSPDSRDIVTPIAYDQYGRIGLRYQPYISSSGINGSFRSNALSEQAAYYQNPGTGIKPTSHPFSVTVYEPSPLNKILEEGAPGTPWQPVTGSTSGHTEKTDYSANSANEVRLWIVNIGGANGTTFYNAGTLHKTITKDENWISGKIGTVEEFKDFDDNIVLKRIWETETKSLSTYYVYDNIGNFKYVLPPAVNENGQNISTFQETDAVFDQYIYGYNYDGRRRVIERKIPGKGWEFMVYNSLNKLVLSQDAVQRAKNPSEWSFIKYNSSGKTIITGIYQSGSSREDLQNVINVQSGNLWETRDDTNTSGSGNSYTNQTIPTTNISYLTINYYDDYDFLGNIFGQPTGNGQVSSIRTRSLLTGTMVNIVGTSRKLLTVNYYDDKGRIIQTKSQNHLNGTDEVNDVYNFSGELVSSTLKHTPLSGLPTTMVTKHRYDHMGRELAIISSINGQPEVITSRLYYNDLGQLLEKKHHSLDSVNFLQNIKYAYNERGWLKNSLSNEFSEVLGYEEGGQWNGNISTADWGATQSPVNKYIYTYDQLNRLTSAVSTGVTMSESLSYDLMSNINSLRRDGGSVNQYHYNGNRLTSVDNVTGNYSYDLNGNVTQDGRTGFAINYNHLNLPSSTSNSGTNVSYVYDALGNKIQKISSVNGTTDYVGDIQYQNGVIDFILTDDGLARNNSGTYSYEYNLKDHLGNVRHTFNQDPVTHGIQKLQEDNYYGFGLRKVSSAGNNKYLYNGKELQEEFNQYDYGARFYDPVTARWNVIDPLAEEFEHVSPYNYALNNPILMIDPDGMAADTAKKILPPEKPSIDLKEVVILATVDRGITYGGTRLGAWGLMPYAAWQYGKWQAKDENILKTASVMAWILSKFGVDKKYLYPSAEKPKEKAGSGTPRKRSAKKHRKDWEKAENKPWPKEPEDPTKNQVAHHKTPLADNGFDGYPNIEPMPRKDHIEHHRKNGDAKRWGERKKINSL